MWCCRRPRRCAHLQRAHPPRHPLRRPPRSRRHRRRLRSTRGSSASRGRAARRARRRSRCSPTRASSSSAAGAADLRAGRIDPRIVAVLSALATSYPITVGALASDHPQFSGGAVSPHYLGRGVDIAAVDGQPVNAANLPARELAGALAAPDESYRPDQVGSPWAIPAPGFFTDAAHQSMIHIVFTQPIDPRWTPPPP